VTKAGGDPDVMTFNTLMKLAGRHSGLAAAEHWFHEALAAGMSQLVDRFKF